MYEKMKLKVKMAGCAEYNGINCRLTTAFKNDNNEEFFIEISTAHQFLGKERYDWLHISSIFNLIDSKESYTKILHDYAIQFNKLKKPYTLDNIKSVFNELGLSNVEIIFCDYYQKKEYTPLGNNCYILGNVNEKTKQLSLWEEL